MTVEPDLTLPGHPEVLALGDMVRVRRSDGGVQALLGVAPVAMQQGRYAAKLVRARLSGHPIGPFRYLDKGNLATIGRARAVADLHAIRLSGFPAWAAWLVVHLFYLVGFQNRLIVVIRWFISFATRGRGARLITSALAAEDDRQNAEINGVPGLAVALGQGVEDGMRSDTAPAQAIRARATGRFARRAARQPLRAATPSSRPSAPA